MITFHCKSVGKALYFPFRFVKFRERWFLFIGDTVGDVPEVVTTREAG